MRSIKELMETNDCVVKTYMFATGVDYDTAWRVHNEAGRKPRKGMHPSEYTRAWYAQGWAYGGKMLDPPRTMRALHADDRFRTGTWIIGIHKHLVCVRDGIVHDWTRGRKHHIEYVLPFVRRDDTRAVPLDVALRLSRWTPRDMRVVSNIFIVHSDKGPSGVRVGQQVLKSFHHVALDKEYHELKLTCRIYTGRVYHVRLTRGGFRLLCGDVLKRTDTKVHTVSGWAEGARLADEIEAKAYAQQCK